MRNLVLSYSRQTDHYIERVLEFRCELEAAGFTVWSDHSEPAPQSGWPREMEERFTGAQFVLCVCSPDYRDRFEGTSPPGVGLGVAWEADLIRQAIYDTRGRLNKFIPVLFDSQTRAAIPNVLRRYRSIRWPKERTELLALLRGPICLVSSAIGDGDSPREYFPNNLPFPPNRHFSDAAGHLAQLRQFAADKTRQPRALALVGLGGVGKTQLAVQLAHVEANSFSAVLWVRAATIDEFRTNLANLARPLALDLPDCSEWKRPRAMAEVQQWFRDHAEWLLIVDGADTPNVRREIAEFFTGCNGGAILVTSRLTTGWETMMPTMELLSWSSKDAVAFIQQRNPRSEDAMAVKRFADTLCGLPLALEQAMAFVVETGISLARYVELFNEARSRLLAQKSPGATNYPESVAGTWLVTLEHLAPLSRSLLRLAAFLADSPLPRVAVLRGAPVLELGLTLLAQEDSQVLSGENSYDEVAVEQAVGELARYSFAVAGAEMLIFHPLLSAVEEDRTPVEARDEWEGLALAWVNGNTPADPGEPVLWPTFWQMERHILRVVGGKVVLPMLPDKTVRLILVLGIFYRGQACYEMSFALLNHALECARRFLPPSHHAITRILHALGSLAQDLGLHDRAEETMRLTLSRAEKEFGRKSEAVAAALNNLGFLLLDIGRSTEAEPLLRAALALARRHFPNGNRGIAAALGNLSRALADVGKIDEAEPLAEEAVEVAQQSGGSDEPERARQLVHLARLRSERRRHAEAEQLGCV